MSRSAGIALLLAVMIVLIVAVDVLFLRDRFWLRLAVNIGVVALAGIVYLTFLPR